MSKRRSDNSQVRKEDYDGEDGGVSNDFSSGRFQRADAATLQRRKIVSARTRQRPTIAPPPADDAPTPSSGSVWGNIDLRASSSSSSNKVTNANTNTTASFVSFAAAPSAAAQSFGNFGTNSSSAVAASTSNSSRGSTKYYNLSKKLAASFKAACASNPLTCEMSLLMRQYIHYYDKLEADYCREYRIPPVAAAQGVAPVAAPTPVVIPTPAPTAAAAAPAPPAPAARPAVAPPKDNNAKNDKHHDNEPSARPTGRDEGWNTVESFERVHIYRKEDPNDNNSNWKKWVDGPLLLQRFQADPDNVTRILMRDAAGLKVLVNLSFKGVKTERKESQNKKSSSFIFKALMDQKKDEDGKDVAIWETLLIRIRAGDADRMQRGLADLAQPQN